MCTAPSRVGFLCSQCDNIAEYLCPDCVGELYCSEECREAHFPQHSVECAIGVRFETAMKKYRPAKPGNTIGKFIKLGFAAMKFSMASQIPPGTDTPIVFSAKIIDTYNIEKTYKNSLEFYRSAGKLLYIALDPHPADFPQNLPHISKYANFLESEIAHAVEFIVNARIIPGLHFSTVGLNFGSRFVGKMLEFRAEPIIVSAIKVEWESLFEAFLTFSVLIAELRNEDVEDEERKQETIKRIKQAGGAVLAGFNRVGTVAASFLS